MATINSILSGYSFSKGLISSVGLPAAEKGQPSKTEGQDTFVIGQEGQNKAQVRDQNSARVLGRANRAYGLPLPVGRLQESGEQENVIVSDIGKNDPGKVDREQVSFPGSNEEDNTKGVVNPNAENLSEEEKQQLAQLQEVDREVKAHEMAHLLAAGGYARSGASFQYKQGPDGKKYAVGGEVSIDIGREASPEKTIEKMRVVRGAALAPAHPSSQDQRIAARATLYIAEAAQELRLEGQEGGNAIDKEADKVTGVAGEEASTATVSVSENNRNTNRFGVSQAGSSIAKSFSSPLYPSVSSRSYHAAVDLFA